MAALITCIIPNFNGAPYLKEALDSIVAQTYRQLEIIVVDDGSTDESAELVAACPGDVTLIRQPHLGLAAARNCGLRAARGEHIAFLDHDDVWHPHKLARQMAELTARPELHASVTLMRNFWDPAIPESGKPQTDPMRTLLVSPYSPQTLLARRSMFEIVGPFDSRLWYLGDVEWFRRAAALRPTVLIEALPEVLVYRRLHMANMSWEHIPAGELACLRAARRAVKRFRNQGNAPTPFPTERAG